MLGGKFLAALVIGVFGIAAGRAHAGSWDGPVIRYVNTDRAMYALGQDASIYVTLVNRNSAPFSGTLTLAVRDLGATIGPVQTQEVAALATNAWATYTFRVAVLGPTDHGHLVTVEAADQQHHAVDHAATALDVSKDWRMHPRYGVVTRFDGSVEPLVVVQALNTYHVNAVMFFDVNWQHHRPFVDASSWHNLANNVIHRDDVRGLVGAVHHYGMLAFDYNLWNGAYNEYPDDGSNVALGWGMFAKNCTPHCRKADQANYGPFPSSWATQHLQQFDGANIDWQHYLFKKQAAMLNAFNFDGWQIDTLGDPGRVWSAAGRSLDSEAALRPFATAAAAATGRRVVMNAVNRWGEADIAKAPVDVIYSELWGATESYASVAQAAEQGRRLGKSVVFAAYMNSGYGAAHPGCTSCTFNEASVRLMDATVTAGGANHLEFHDVDQMIFNDYYANSGLAMGGALQVAELDLANFAVAYEALLRDASPAPPIKVSTGSTPSGAGGEPGTVWTQAKSVSGGHVLHLINLLAATSTSWRDNEAKMRAPEDQPGLAVTLAAPAGSFGSAPSVVWASPDWDHGDGHPLAARLSHSRDGDRLTFALPHLTYWDMVYVKTANGAH